MNYLKNGGKIYLLHRRLGSGLEGTVYKAYEPDVDPYFEFPICVKVLKSRNLDFKLIRFWKKLGALEVRGIPRFHTIFRYGFFNRALVYDFVEGADLEKLIRYSVLDPLELSYIFDQVRLIIEKLGENSLFHGDLKPANILVTKESKVFLVDFCPDEDLITPIYYSKKIGKKSVENDLFALQQMRSENHLESFNLNLRQVPDLKDRIEKVFSEGELITEAVGSPEVSLHRFSLARVLSFFCLVAVLFLSNTSLKN
ncbi:MAG: protein kinase [Bdellovibrionales bacterium]